MSDDPKYQPPKSSLGDKAHTIVKAGVNLTPIAGGSASELLNLIVTPPLEKRRIKWMEEVGEGLRKLEGKHKIDLESLQDNDDFIDVVLEATTIAMKTSNQRKREALKNAILNTANNTAPDESLRIMFLSYIDTFTEWHIKLFVLFNDPQGYLDKNNLSMGNIVGGGPDNLIHKAFPELREKRDFYDSIWKDLFAKALVTGEMLHGQMTLKGILSRRTSKIGDDFLKFIESPIQE